MDDSISSTTQATIGLDLGDRYAHYCHIDEGGEIIDEGRVATTARALTREYEHALAVRIVIEAGCHSPWVSRLLEGFGHEVIVANPRQLRLIYRNDSKSDRVDAEYLARVGRLDPQLLFPIRHRKADTQADRALLRSRELLIRTRTRMISHIRGLVKSIGGRIPRAHTACFATKAREYIPVELLETVAPLLDQINAITQQIKAYNGRIEMLAGEKYPEVELLTQVNGVGTLTALAFILAIEDPYRFRNSRAVASYLGLRPRQDDSGSHQPQLRITKAGDPMLRQLLVQCANHILGPLGKDSDLRIWGHTLAERGGKNAKKRARVAVARRLSVVLLSMLKTGEAYDPLHGSHDDKVSAA